MPKTKQEKEIQDYRHDTEKRKNNPPAGIAAQGKMREKPKQEYAYNPHLPPTLRFDDTGNTDKLPELLEKALNEKLSIEDVETIADVLKRHEPWLEWASKQEDKIVYRRSGSTPYPRARQCQSHPQGR